MYPIYPLLNYELGVGFEGKTVWTRIIAQFLDMYALYIWISLNEEVY